MDLGTTFVAAARSGDSQVEMLTLGDRSVVMPSAVFVTEGGEVLAGEAAERRAASHPERVARQFKRRLGDPTPIRLGEASYSATELLAILLREVLARVTTAEGEPPGQVVLTHPANWGRFRRGIFTEVPRAAGLTDDVLTLTEPEAAALHYANSRRLGSDELIAVYDLGGGTFDATILATTPAGVTIVGTPEGVERLGGIDFDHALYDHLNHTSDGALDDLDHTDPQTTLALARVRQDCVLAKETLSLDTETLVPIFLPGRHFDIRITRTDFENLIRAHIESTITALTRTLASAHIHPNQLNAVLLVGGSSRIPLVARMVSDELHTPTLVDTHPKYAVALGAATSTHHPRPPWDTTQTTTPDRAHHPHPTRTTPRRTRAAAVLFAGIATLLLIALAAFGWTLRTPGSNPPAPRTTPQSGPTAPVLPTVLPAPRHVPGPNGDAVVLDRAEPVWAVRNGNILSELDIATLTLRWAVTVPNGQNLVGFGDESVGMCAGEPRLMTACTPVNLTTRTVEPTFPLPGQVFSIKPIDGGQKLVLLNQDGVVNVMDSQTHALRSIPLPEYRQRGESVLTDVGGHRAYFVRDLETLAPVLTIVDLDTLAVTTAPWPSSVGPIAGRTWSLKVSQDGSSLYMIIDQDLLRFDGATMTLQYEVPQHAPLTRSLVTTPDGRYLCLLTADGELRVIEAATGRQVSSGHTGSRPTWLDLTDRGRQVVVQTDNGYDLFDTSAFAGS